MLQSQGVVVLFGVYCFKSQEKDNCDCPFHQSDLDTETGWACSLSDSLINDEVQCPFFSADVVTVRRDEVLYGS